MDALNRRVARLASDREFGASELLEDAIGILRDAVAGGVPVVPIAREVCRAQPSMAPMWNAALAALASGPGADALDQFARRAARAPAALVRVAVEFLADTAEPPHAGPFHVVTLSYSATVARVLEAVAATWPLRVSCAESRPAMEGRRLAARLAAAGIPVSCFGDAAVGGALASADAVLVGADAVAPERIVNKSGTRMLAAAGQQGVPVYVAATREKFVSSAVAGRLTLHDGDPGDIWEAPPPGVSVQNPYFERVPLELVASVITDAGVLGVGMVPDVCAAIERVQRADLLSLLS